MKVVHLITSLDIGGAQTMLCKLLSGIQNPQIEYSVITLIDKGKLGKSIETLGIPVHEIRMKTGLPSLSALWRLVELLKKLKPDVIQAWTYHANIAATISAWILLGRIPVVWSIHHSIDNISSEKPLTRFLIWFGALISRCPVKIHYCSVTSADQHKAMGYASDLCKVIPNGFDCVTFQPSPFARNNLHEALRITDDIILIGTAARYHPMKDHANFILAAGELAKYYPNVHFIMAGRNIDSDNQTLVESIKGVCLDQKVHLLGERTDMPEILAGLDIFSTSSAWGESFPIVIGEAMACGVPCAVTNIGDSAQIVGDTGVVVPPKDPQALANAWRKLIMLGSMGRKQLGTEARKRIEENYALPSIVRKYESLYQEILGWSTVI